MNKKAAAAAACLIGVLVSGCATKQSFAPIEDKSSYTALSKSGAQASLSAEIAPLAPGQVKDSGRTHVVSPGDTLYNISNRYGVDVRSLATLNAVVDPTQLRLGQVLRLPESTFEAKTESSGSVRVSKISSGSSSGPSTVVKDPIYTKEEAPQITNNPDEGKATAKPVVVKQPAKQVVPGTKMLWPARGPILSDFAANGKGLDIGGRIGDVVVAAADGEVIFAGDGVRGYGNLVIIKHTPAIVTAYGHNSKLVVAKGDKVKAGQKIAELGKLDADVPKVRFEVRQSGVPVDPAKFMAPKRD